jgi:hypothetical protein
MLLPKEEDQFPAVDKRAWASSAMIDFLAYKKHPLAIQGGNLLRFHATLSQCKLDSSLLIIILVSESTILQPRF